MTMIAMSETDFSTKTCTYLAEIYRMTDWLPESDCVGTSALADVLNVSPPAINRMVNKLKEQNLLVHEPYQGVQLTPQGRDVALQRLRDHRIVESFLVKVMGISWDIVYDEAQRLCPAISPDVAQKMYQMAEEPSFCPHGEPIPTEDGDLVKLNDLLLSEVQPQSQVEVTRFRTREADRLQYLQALGLLVGTQFEVLHIAPFNGPMQLKVGNEYRIIGYNLAELIRVKHI